MIMELRQNPFSPEQEWREKRLARPIPDTVPQDLYWAVDELLEPKHEPQLFAKGGEHLVLRLKHGGSVVKVNYLESQPMYEALLNNDRGAMDASLRRMQERRRRYLEKIKVLEQYFGRNAVPRQRVLIAEVPVSAAVANGLGQGLEAPDAGGPRSMPAWIAVQRELDLDPARTVSLGGYYLEDAVLASREPADIVRYGKVHDILLGPPPTSETERERQTQEVVGLFDDLEKVVKRLERDPGFKPALQQAVRKMISYSSETQEVLDVAGLDNIVLSKDGDDWSLKMPDALSAFECTYGDLRQSAKKLYRGEELDNHEETKAYYAMNTLRVINALALLADIQERLRIPGVKNVSAETWLQALSEAVR